MPHEYDGYDERWEAEIYNKHNDEEEQLFLNKIRRRVVRTLENNLDNSKVGHLDFNFNNIQLANNLDNGPDVEISTEHGLLKDKLVTHLE
jgi:hypothetical protein